jgi:hypothetical protein
MQASFGRRLSAAAGCPGRFLFLAVAGLIAVAAPGAGGSADRQTAQVQFRKQAMSRSTGTRLAIDYVNPAHPKAKPYAVERTVTHLQRGTQIDTSVPGQCQASDAALMAEGAAACPDGSRVGSGEITLDTGFPGSLRRLEFNVTLFNNDSQLIFLLEPKSGPMSRSVSRATVQGRTIISEVPPIPGGPPDGFTAIKRVSVHTHGVTVGSGADRRMYTRTPSFCPASGWRNRTIFTYRDGEVEKVASPSPCTGPPPP